ncbi:MAG: 2-oxoglutarate dehydrogenase E1 component, partial [Alphaproteobacteria bacterium]|nr:2-oxoglutarate dehydrogenase E1 component [Alphaproteobacteria bacterium]
MDNSFLTGTNATFVAEMYQRWKQHPNSVDTDWSDWFANLDSLAIGELDEQSPSWGRPKSKVVGATDPEASIKAVAKGIAGNRDLLATDVRSATLDSLRAIMLIRAYRVRGHLIANLDPLNLQDKEIHPELDPETYGFTLEDFDRPIFINYVLGLEIASVNEILAVLKETYCSTIGVEFMHIQDPAQKAWIQERIEAIGNRTEFTERGKIAIYEKLLAAENFEQFLHKKYIGTKRFGLDGGEALVPALEQILKRGGQMGLKEVVVGMAHRGRLNILHNVLDKPFRAIISEFLGNPANPEEAGGSGDVKYHMGASADRQFDDDEIHLSLAPNPSHLEIVDPVVIGRVRAKQAQRSSHDFKEVLGIILHGDAAFAGQGVVAETFAFSALRGYRTGGTIHIVVNNQIGFTTSPAYSRSSPYPTDVAKMVMSPIFHVNGDDPEAVVTVSRMALAYRQRFGKSVFINLVTYRRHGHNEADEPAHTQPMMYAYIRKHPSTFSIYANNLIAQSVMDDASVKALQQEIKQRMGRGDCLIDDLLSSSSKRDQRKSIWHKFLHKTWKTPHKTSFSKKRFLALAKAMAASLEGVNLHRQIANLMKQRAEMTAETMPVRWGYAELMAYATLIDEGYSIRIVGEDACRGTFAHRHAVIHDTQNGHMVTPLHHLPDSKAKCSIYNASLSEFASMGFEYGYAITDPNTLVVWEAQFGDFANGAQVIIDQFLSSGWQKWQRLCGLVLFLP